jgi:hypothetical protein
MTFVDLSSADEKTLLSAALPVSLADTIASRQTATAPAINTRFLLIFMKTPSLAYHHLTTDNVYCSLIFLTP